MFLIDGEVPLDNNVTEGAIRSFCLHKHAWKLIDSIDGAKVSVIIYSITETARANNLNSFHYLDHVLTVLKDNQDDTDYSFIEKLLPWSDQLPEICRSKVKNNQSVNLAAGNGGQKMRQYLRLTVYYISCSNVCMISMVPKILSYVG